MQQVWVISWQNAHIADTLHIRHVHKAMTLGVSIYVVYIREPSMFSTNAPYIKLLWLLVTFVSSLHWIQSWFPRIHDRNTYNRLQAVLFSSPAENMSPSLTYHWWLWQDISFHFCNCYVHVRRSRSLPSLMSSTEQTIHTRMPPVKAHWAIVTSLQFQIQVCVLKNNRGQPAAYKMPI